MVGLVRQNARTFNPVTARGLNFSNDDASYVDLGNIGVLEGLTELTIECCIWIRKSANSGAPRIVCSDDSNVAHIQINDLLSSSQSLHFRVADSGGNWKSFVSGTDPVSTNEWIHVAAIYDGQDEILLENAREVGRVRIGNITTNAPGDLMGIASKQSSGAHFGDDGIIGWVQEVKTWNRARLPSEIARDMRRQLSGREPGLTGYWPLNERSVGTAYDRSTNKNHGTLVNGPQRLETKAAHPHYVSLDGDDDYLDFGDKSVFEFASGQSFTVEWWAYQPSSQSTTGSILAKGYANPVEPGDTTPWYKSQCAYQVDTNVGTPAAEFYIRDSSDSDSRAIGTTNVYDAWHLTSGVYDASNAELRLYVDGQLEDTVTGVPEDAYGANSEILACGVSNGEFVKFDISELRIWAETRTQSQIRDNLYTNFSGNETNLRFLAQFNEGGGDIAHDKTSNDNHGTLAEYNSTGRASWAAPQPPSPPASGQGMPYFLEFDGSDDYIALDRSFATQGTFTELTVELWIRIDSSTDGGRAALAFDGSEYFSASTGDGVTANTKGGVPVFLTTDSSGTFHDFFGNTDITGTGWRVVSYVFDGDKAIYIDGSQDATVSDPHSGNSLGTGASRYGFIGDGSEATSFDGTRNESYFSGRVAEIRLWEVARTQTQIQDNLYAHFSGQESGLLNLWQFNEGGGTTANDKAGSGTGTLKSADGSDLPIWHKG